jgi:hypothetical protein
MLFVIVNGEPAQKSTGLSPSLQTFPTIVRHQTSPSPISGLNRTQRVGELRKIVQKRSERR